jgi:PAS domain S-box-containing protein
MAIYRKIKKISLVLSVVVALIGLLVLIGWLGDFVFLKSISPNWISMKANAAICFLLGGATILLVSWQPPTIVNKRLASAFSFIIFTIGALTLVQYIFSINIGIDELFFKDNGLVFENIAPGRQSPTSAAYFMVFGLCYLQGTDRLAKTILFQILNLLSGVIILIALMSYLLGSYVIAGVTLNFIHVIHSTIGFLFLILAVLFSQPKIGIMKLVGSNTRGGKIIRQTIPIYIFLFVLLGWLRLKGEQLGFYNEILGLSVYITLMIIIMGYLVFSNAISYIESARVLTESEERLNRAEQMGNLGYGFYDIETGTMELSAGLYSIFGVTKESFLHTIDGLKNVIHPGDNNIMEKAVNTLLVEGKVDVEFRILQPTGHIRNVFFKTVLTKNEKGDIVNTFTTAQDVTENKKAAETLYKSEEKYRTVVEQADDGIFIAEKSGNFITSNNRGLEMSGYTLQELKTLTFYDLIPPEDVQKRPLQIQPLYEGKTIISERPIKRKNGEIITVEVKGKALDDGRILLFTRDITEKIQAAEAVKTSEDKYKQLVEQADDGIFIANHTGKFITVNPKAQELSGYTMQELLNMSIYDVTIAEDLAKNPFQFKELMEGKTATSERPMRTKSGAIIEVEIKAKFLTNGDMLVFFRDISQRKKSENELREKKAFIDSLINATPDIIYINDIKEGINVYTNEGAYRNIGYTKDELRDMGTTAMGLLIHPADIEGYLLNVHPQYSRIGDKEVITHELRMRDKESNWHWFYCRESIFSRTVDGKPKEIFGIATNITKRKQAEERTKAGEAQLRQIFNATYDIIFLVSALPAGKFRCDAVNKKLLDLTGVQEAAIVGKDLDEITPLDLRLPMYEKFKEAIDSRKSIQWEQTYTFPTGKRTGIVSLAPILDNTLPGITQLVGTVHDITQSKKDALLLSCEKEVVEKLIQNEPLEEILKTICLNYEMVVDKTYCSVLLLDDEGTHVHHGAAPSLPAEYIKAIDGLVIGDFAGSCGTAAYKKEKIIVSDISTSPLWSEYKDTASKFGLKACWSVPILNIDNKPLATFAVYYKECKTPSEEDIKLLDRAASKVKIVLERGRYERMLKESQERYRNLIHSSQELIQSMSVEGKIEFVNPKWLETMGYTEKEAAGLEIKNIVNEKDLQHCLSVFNRVIKGENIREIEAVFKTKEGKKINVEGSIMPHKINNEIVGTQAFFRNVTERKITENKLKEQQAILRLFVENSPVALAMLDRQMNYVITSKRWTTDYKLEQMDIIGKNHYDIFPEISNEWKQLHQRCLAGAAEKNEEDMFVRADGTIDWVRWEIHPWHDADGEVGGIILFSELITERKRSREQIIQTNKHLERAEQQALLGSWEFNISTQTGKWSKQMFRLLGFDIGEHPPSLDDYLGKIHPEDKQFVQETMFDIVKGRKPAIRIFRTNPEILPLRYLIPTAYLEKDTNDTVVKISGTISDITKQVKAEEQLRVSEKKYRLLFENNPMPMWIYSVKTTGFIEVNDAALRHYGYTREEFKKMSIHDIRSQKDIEKLKEITSDNYRGIHHAGAWDHIKKDGTVIKVEIITHDMDYEGEHVRLVLANDITEKVEAQAKLVESLDAMRRLSAHLQYIREEERKNIGRDIHDELGQQLTAIKMDVAWVDKKIEESEIALKTKLKNTINLLDSCNHSLRKILTELRSHITDNRSLIDALELLGMQFKINTGIGFSFKTSEPDIIAEVPIANCLFRTLQESLTNITRYAKATDVRVSLIKSEKSIALSIKDNGVGFVLSEKTKPDSFGIIGLRERVASLNGTFDLYSAPGNGTAITVSIPFVTDTKTN